MGKRERKLSNKVFDKLANLCYDGRKVGILYRLYKIFYVELTFTTFSVFSFISPMLFPNNINILLEDDFPSMSDISSLV